MQRLRELSLFLCALGLLIFPAASARAQSAPPAANLDDILKGGLDRGLPCVTIIVQRDGEDPISATADVASLEARLPLAAADFRFTASPRPSPPWSSCSS